MLATSPSSQIRTCCDVCIFARTPTAFGVRNFACCPQLGVRLYDLEFAFTRICFVSNHGHPWEDVSTLDIFSSFKVSGVQLLDWDHPTMQFLKPDQIGHQLVLTQNLLNIYEDFQLPLPSMKSKSQDPHDCQQVLNARCLLPSQKVPTLCASYSAQHDLQKSHIAAKGLFTTLIHEEGEHVFMNPGIKQNLTIRMAIFK